MQQFRTSLAHETDCERGLATSQPGAEGTTESVARRVLILSNESHILKQLLKDCYVCPLAAQRL